MDLTGVKGESLGHLGLIAATIQDAGIMEKIDEQLGQMEGSVKHGHRVGAMILNGLGFINCIFRRKSNDDSASNRTVIPLEAER